MMGRKRMAIVLLLAVFCVATLSACVDFDFSSGNLGRVTGTDDPGGQSVEVPNVRDSVVNIQTAEPREPSDTETLADVVDKIRHSVVEITAETSSGTSAGSGVVISVAEHFSYVLTCHHVIDGGIQSMKVTFTDGQTQNAFLAGSHPDKDIAVIKIPKKDSHVAVNVRDLNTDPLRLAEDVIVIGNPLGTLGGSVTRGIISATEREVTVENLTMTLIQTDASINSGNSGGGIFDDMGSLIGIVNAKASGTGIEGLGFAIPIDVAIDIAGTLILTANDADNAYNFIGYIPGVFKLGIITQLQEDYTCKIVGVYSYGTITNKVKINSYVVSVLGTNLTKDYTLQEALKTLKVGDTLILGIKESKSSSTTSLEATLKQYVYGFTH